MTPDHMFVDSLGAMSRRPAIEEGWRSYFEMVPDYWIKIDWELSADDIIILIGKAGGTYVPEGKSAKSENKWETPAAWVAKTRDGLIAEWRIYSDNEPIRARMRLSEQSPRPSV